MNQQKSYILIIFIIILSALLVLAWFYFIRIPPLKGIVSGNGRLEATQIDIATKFQGRVAEILFDEGDMVKAGDIVARIDTES
ncbi:MAG: biotin/lipoyl-binding protein, partial [Candidatus Dadabacteria bacterium]|nr:biotin/lipoyl-binding protein [Candidatus Dadabacteria bacterium]